MGFSLIEQQNCSVLAPFGKACVIKCALLPFIFIILWIIFYFHILCLCFITKFDFWILFSS